MKTLGCRPHFATDGGDRPVEQMLHDRVSVLWGRLRGANPAHEMTRRRADRLATAVNRLTEVPCGPGADRIRCLLADPDVARFYLSDGQPLRTALVEAQSRLGFPWALEVEPADLSLLRPARPFWSPERVAAVTVAAVALAGMLLFGSGWLARSLMAFLTNGMSD